MVESLWGSSPASAVCGYELLIKALTLSSMWMEAMVLIWGCRRRLWQW